MLWPRKRPARLTRMSRRPESSRGRVHRGAGGGRLGGVSLDDREAVRVALGGRERIEILGNHGGARG